MFFDGCAPDLGCSLVLRGGNRKTLKRLRKIVEYLIYVAYQLKLEAKFLADEFALPPSLVPDVSLNTVGDTVAIGTGTSNFLHLNVIKISYYNELVKQFYCYKKTVI